jgi:hypothetical protein
MKPNNNRAFATMTQPSTPSQAAPAVPEKPPQKAVREAVTVTVFKHFASI